MERADACHVNRPLVSNILSSFADKGFTLLAQMAAMVITVRFLPRADYGVIGVVAGYAAFMQIINVSLDSAILRDHRSWNDSPERFLASFICFNLLKAIPLILCGGVLAAVLPVLYSRESFLWAVLSMTILAVTESIIAPLVIYASAKYQQRLVTRLNILRYSLNVLLLPGLILQPTLAYLFVKDVAVMAVLLIAWICVARRSLDLSFSRISFRRDVDPAFILRTLTQYSLWVHLVNVTTAFIYRADAFFLSFFAPLGVVGNYNVALSSANVANVAPSLLGYQNSVALSNCRSQRDAFRLTDSFMRLSAYVGAAMLLGFSLLGIPYLQVVTGDTAVVQTYVYMLCIVTGLILVKTVASPIVAYVNVKGDVRGLFLRVMLPVLCFAALAYYVAASRFGAIGVAVSNVLIAIAWLVLLLVEIRRYGYRMPDRSGFADDLQRVQAHCLGWVRRAARPRHSGGQP